MQRYLTVATYVQTARRLLQDLVLPYRYPDDLIVDSLNHAVAEISRIRADIFLDLKYQRRLRKGDIDDGLPPSYSVDDMGTLVPIPSKYVDPVHWYVSGWLQIYDVTDTQDQRAQAFLQKFQQQLMTTSAA